MIEMNYEQLTIDMLMDEDTAYSICCISCQYYSVYQEKSKCKRFVYPHVIEPYRNPFTCCDTGEHHIICDQYKPSNVYTAICREWVSFDDWYRTMIVIEPYKVLKNQPVYVNGDTDTMYMVTADEFFHGFHVVDGKLHYQDKSYYRMCRSGCGYKLVHDGKGNIELNES